MTTTATPVASLTRSINERRQFRALYRSFLFRIIDLQLLSASGDVRNLLVQFASLLAAYSFVLAILAVARFGNFPGDHAKLLTGAWGVEEFLLSTTITVAGLLAILTWNTVLPDRRDIFILDPMPLRTGAILRPKAAALATALGVSLIAVNIFTGISLPFLVNATGSGVVGVLRCFLAYWTIVASAGLFIFAAILSLQIIAAALFSFSAFQRISGLLQLLAFFAILALFFLTPPLATPARISSASNQPLLAWLPSYWFLGLFHELNGTAIPALSPLAARATFATLGVCLLILATAALTFQRIIRRTIEQPDIKPGKSTSFVSNLAPILAIRFINDPLHRAILLFSSRTLARSREHRLILAGYIGLAFAIALAFVKSFLYRTADPHWDQPNAPLLTASLVLLFFFIIGTRAVFSLPYVLPANWIFRITAVRPPSAYFAAIRKTLFVLAAIPVIALSALVYLSIWPGRPALQHLVLLSVLAAFIVQFSSRALRKIPFACSYLPGKSNLRLKFGIAGFLFLLAVDVGADIEHWSLERPARYTVLLTLLTAAAWWAHRRTAAFANSPHNRVQFEDVAPADVYPLDFRRDAEGLDGSDYLDAVSAPAYRPFASRMKIVAFGCALLMIAGFAYEKFGEWRDHQKFRQVGRSVNIGGRALNLYCSGSGTPAVVLDSGAGMPGLSWKLVERGAATLTRSCWYDRAGYGWSDPGPKSQAASDVARDLHTLLHAAGIAPPYILVGHSLGGFHVRVYASQYPTEVAGLVLVDSADEYETPSRVPKSLQSPANRYIPRRLMPLIAQIGRLPFRAGFVRLFDNGVAARDGRLSLRDTLEVHTLQRQPKAFDASLNEGLSRGKTLEEVKAIHGFGTIPLTVLSGAKKPVVPLADEEEAELLDRYVNYRVHVTQAHLATLSTRGRQVILKNVGHAIPTEAPEAVVNAIRDILQQQATAQNPESAAPSPHPAS